MVTPELRQELERLVQEAAERGATAALERALARELPDEVPAADAARMLGHPSAAALRKWVERNPGKLNPRKDGTRWVYSRREIVAHLAKG